MPQPLSRYYPWYVVGVLMLASTLSLLDRQILNLLVGSLRADFGINDSQVGLLLGLCFAVAYSVAGLPLGALADRGNRRNLIIAGLLFWSGAVAALAYARGYGDLLIARAAVAVGEAALAPAAYSLIASSFPPHQVARANSIYALGVCLGVGAAVAIGGLLTQVSVQPGATTLPLLGELRPRQYVLVLLALAGPLLALLLLTVREPPRPAPAGGRRPGLRLLWAHRRLLLLHNLGFAMFALSAYASAAWLPSYFIRNHGWTPGAFGLAYGLSVMLAGGAGVLFAGWLADRPRHRGDAAAPLRLGVYTAVASLLFGLGYLLPVDSRLAMAGVVPAAFLLSMPSVLWPAALQRLLPVEVLGRAVALSLMLTNLLGLGLGPTLVGVLNHAVFNDDQALDKSMFLVCGGAQLLAALLLRAALRAARQSAAEATAVH